MIVLKLLKFFIEDPVAKGDILDSSQVSISCSHTSKFGEISCRSVGACHVKGVCLDPRPVRL